jgi:hypothetical protein
MVTSIQAVPAIERVSVGRLGGTMYADPTDQAEAAPLVSELASLATGNRVHRMPAGPDVMFPFLGYVRRGVPVSDGFLGGPVDWVESEYEIKAVDRDTSKQRIERPAAIILWLLDGFTWPVDGVLVECRLDTELLIDLPPADDGTIYVHAGGIYRFFVSRLTV